MANLLLALKADAFDADQANRFAINAQRVSIFREGVIKRSRAFAKQPTKIAIEAKLHNAPNDSQLHAQLGLMLAYLNRKVDAIREGKHSLSLPQTLKTDTPYLQHQMARIYIAVN